MSTSNGHQEAPAAKPPADDALERILDQIAEQSFELAYIKGSPLYRLASRVRRSRVARALVRASARTVRIRALGERSPGAAAVEVWLLHVASDAGQRCMPWDFVAHGRGWEVRRVSEQAYGHCLIAAGPAEAAIRAGADPELKFVRHPWSGKVEISFRGRTEVIDLYSPIGGVVTVHPARTPMAEAAVTEPSPSMPPPAPAAPATPGFTDSERAFIERAAAARPAAIAVTCPRWLGVTSSTRNLFPFLYHVPASPKDDPYNVPDEVLQHHCDVLLETGCPRIVFSGGDIFQHRMAQMLKARRPSLRIDVFMHASYPQFLEDYTWRLFKLWVEAARNGTVGCIASAKAGYDRFLSSQGVKSAVLLNRVEGSLLPPRRLEGDERHVGVWLSGDVYRKIPHAMLSALSMMPRVRLHGAGLSKRALEVVNFLRIPVGEATDSQIPHDRLLEAIRLTHLTMYVTLVECCPMLPLESLHQGVPALIGPNSHLFEDNRFLFERLVVPFPERAEVIADYAERAIAEREAIVDEYGRYYPAYDARARQSVENFLKS